MPQHQENVMGKKQKDPQDEVTVRVSIEIWDSCPDLCYIVYMQKAAAQLDGGQGRNGGWGWAGQGEGGGGGMCVPT